jgi:hypothetical protein
MYEVESAMKDVGYVVFYRPVVAGSERALAKLADGK